MCKNLEIRECLDDYWNELWTQAITLLMLRLKGQTLTGSRFNRSMRSRNCFECALMVRGVSMCAHPCVFFLSQWVLCVCAQGFIIDCSIFHFSLSLSLHFVCQRQLLPWLYADMSTMVGKINWIWNWKENNLNLSTYSLRSSLAWTSFDSRLRYTSRSRSTLLLFMFNAAQSCCIQWNVKFSEIYIWNS